MGGWGGGAGEVVGWTGEGRGVVLGDPLLNIFPIISKCYRRQFHRILSLNNILLHLFISYIKTEIIIPSF